MSRRPLVGIRLAVPCVASLIAITSSPLTAQVGFTPTEVHVCDDCHGSHDNAPGRSGLIRRGWSEVTPQAPGLGAGSARCLQCHGTAGDREQAERVDRMSGSAPTLLGGSLLDDHPLGTVTPSGRPGDGSPWGFPDVPADYPGGRSETETLMIVECAGCHDPHETGRVTIQGSSQDAMCVGCHDPSLAYNAHGVASCGSCHRQHAAPDRTYFLRESESNYLCGACHQGALLPLHPGIEEIPGSPLHAEPSDPDCKACHTIH